MGSPSMSSRTSIRSMCFSPSRAIFLSTAPGHLRYTRDFASRRNPSRTAAMSRVYAIESTPTLLGSVADHRFIAGPAELRQRVGAIASGILENAPHRIDARLGERDRSPI